MLKVKHNHGPPVPFGTGRSQQAVKGDRTEGEMNAKNVIWIQMFLSQLRRAREMAETDPQLAEDTARAAISSLFVAAEREAMDQYLKTKDIQQAIRLAIDLLEKVLKEGKI